MSDPSKNNLPTLLLVAIVSAAVAVGAFYALQPPRPKTLGEKIDDAASEISKGMKNATDKFDDRSPAQKMLDSIKGK